MKRTLVIGVAAVVVVGAIGIGVALKRNGPANNTIAMEAPRAALESMSAALATVTPSAATLSFKLSEPAAARVNGSLHITEGSNSAALFTFNLDATGTKLALAPLPSGETSLSLLEIGRQVYIRLPRAPQLIALFSADPSLHLPSFLTTSRLDSVARTYGGTWIDLGPLVPTESSADQTQINQLRTSALEKAVKMIEASSRVSRGSRLTYDGQPARSFTFAAPTSSGVRVAQVYVATTGPAVPLGFVVSASAKGTSASVVANISYRHETPLSAPSSSTSLTTLAKALNVPAADVALLQMGINAYTQQMQKELINGRATAL